MDMKAEWERIAAEHGLEVVESWSWPGQRLRAVTESVCGVLDRLPGPAWGCKLQLWRIWAEGSVTRPKSR